MGDARGRWDGNALVIEIDEFQGPQHLPERERRNAAARRTLHAYVDDRIEWAVTVNDPTTWTRPWTFSMPLTKTDAEPVLEFACHEGNYAVPHILSGARAAERAFESATKP